MKRFPTMILVAALSGAATFANAGTSDRESIEVAFDRNKGKIYAEYVRSLKTNPKLHGKIVLQIDIAASGAVTNCGVKSSELHDPDLEGRICARVRQIQFGPRDAAISIQKPIDFYPAA